MCFVGACDAFLCIVCKDLVDLLAVIMGTWCPKYRESFAEDINKNLIGDE